MSGSLGKIIRIFLPDGIPRGVTLAEISNTAVQPVLSPPILERRCQFSNPKSAPPLLSRGLLRTAFPWPRAESGRPEAAFGLRAYPKTAKRCRTSPAYRPRQKCPCRFSDRLLAHATAGLFGWLTSALPPDAPQVTRCGDFRKPKTSAIRQPSPIFPQEESPWITSY